MKNTAVLVLILLLLFTMTGCVNSTDNLIIHTDGSGTSQMLMEVRKEAYDAIIKDLGKSGMDIFSDEKPEIVTKDGTEYYQIKKDTEFASFAELKKILQENYTDVVVSESGIRFCVNAGITQQDYDKANAAYAALGVDMDKMMASTITIKMPKKIEKVSSIGTISADGMTAVFNLTAKDFAGCIDFMVSTAKEETAPTISGVSDKKVYNKPVTFKATDPSGIETAVYRKNDGEETAFPLTKKVNQNGTYKVTATDYYGNTATTTFRIKDTTKPTVTGVKNGKTYIGTKIIKFKDNCGVSKATLNGKKISSGKKITKKGSYKLVVTDINGLKTTVSFKIK